MRLLVVSMLFAPDHAGIAPLATDFASGLADRGHRVVVHTTYPYYPEWRRKSQADPWRVSEEHLGAVTVRRFGLFVPRSPSLFWPRIAHELSFPLSLLRGLGGERFDAIVAFCPLLGSVLHAATRRLLRDEPVWVNVQDIPSDAALATGIGRRGGVGTLAQRLLLRRSELLTGISQQMVERLRSLCSGDRPVALHPNWLVASLERLLATLPDNTGRPAADPPRLLYAGNIGRKQNLLACCRFLASSPLRFQLTLHGDGAEAAAVHAWLAETADPRFSGGGFLPEADFLRALHDADLFLVTERQGSGASFLPSKLIPAIACGTPLLAICDRQGPLGTEVAEHRLGAVVEWSELSALPGTLTRLLAELAEHRAACRRRAAAYARQGALESAEARLSSLVR